MEQFSRECLEIDSETGPDTTASRRVQNSLSMDRVYQRAAKLVKKDFRRGRRPRHGHVAWRGA